MIVNDLKKKKKVIKSLDEKQKKDVKDYLKNLVEKWCQNTPEKRAASIDISWILKETILEMPQKFRAKHFFRKEYFFISE